MTGKASKVTMWPSTAQVLGAFLDRYESTGHPCFEEDECEYADDCDYERTSKCKFAKQLQKVKIRLHKAAYPDDEVK